MGGHLVHGQGSEPLGVVGIQRLGDGVLADVLHGLRVEQVHVTPSVEDRCDRHRLRRGGDGRAGIAGLLELHVEDLQPDRTLREPERDGTGRRHVHEVLAGGPLIVEDDARLVAGFLCVQRLYVEGAATARLVVERGKHHVSAVCHIAAKLVTRLAACGRNGQHYVIRDTDGRVSDDKQGRAIVAERFKVPDEIRRAKRHARQAQRYKKRTGRREKESTASAAPASDPSDHEPTLQPANVA